jgi:hypothetical protein
VPPRPPHTSGGDADAVELDNATAGITITPETPIPDWDGTPPDYSLAVGHLYDVSAETPSDEMAATG